jgi:hypothetical protein
LGEWSDCSLTCGGGEQERIRSCKGPFYGGMDCLESRSEIYACNIYKCPIDGVWEDWENGVIVLSLAEVENKREFAHVKVLTMVGWIVKSPDQRFLHATNVPLMAFGKIGRME